MSICVTLVYYVYVKTKTIAAIQPGYKYDGEYNEKNQRHGQGHAEFHNGDFYDGQYENGKRHGRGVYKLVCHLSELAQLEKVAISDALSRDGKFLPSVI